MSEQFEVIYGVKVLRPEIAVEARAYPPYWVEKYGPVIGWAMIGACRAVEILVPIVLLAICGTCWALAIAFAMKAVR